jgi:hypothetical protein
MEKSSQLQIRLSPVDKRHIDALAKRAGLPVSAWVLSRLLPPSASTFERICVHLSNAPNPAYVYAELNDFLSALSAAEFSAAVVHAPPRSLDPEPANYLAAMVEQAAAELALVAPEWTRDIAPLAHPVFASDLMSLRLYLLVHALPPFRRRNLFVDSSLGARV